MRNGFYSMDAGRKVIPGGYGGVAFVWGLLSCARGRSKIVTAEQCLEEWTMCDVPFPKHKSCVSVLCVCVCSV